MTSPPVSGPILRGARVLIVEDEAIIAEHLRRPFDASGYRVIGTGATAEDALREAARIGPDVVVLDLRLAGTMDGEHAALVLRRCGIPVVLITSCTDETVRALQAIGCNYVLKPFDEDELLAAIQEAIRREAVG